MKSAQALAVFARQPTLAAIEVCAYNPALDPDGAAARRVIELLVEVLSPRLEMVSAQRKSLSQSQLAAPAARAVRVPRVPRNRRRRKLAHSI